MNTNQQIINSAISTNSLSTAGLLNPEQASRFLQQTFEATPLTQLVRHQMRRAKTGTIEKIGIGSRIIRKKTESSDDNYRGTVTPSKIEYATTAVRLPWEITGETLRENIEGAGFEATITNLMTQQLGVDLEDLYLNGDTSVSASDPDHDFLYINDGWVKQIAEGGHVYDASSETSMNLDMFYRALKSLPNKYNNGKLRFLMSPYRVQEWEQYLLDKVITAGGAVPESVYSAPAAIPIIACPMLPDDTILLTDPQNLIVVNTYDMMIKKTDQGKEAIMQDTTYYVVHLDYDAIIEELDGTAIITGIGGANTASADTSSAGGTEGTGGTNSNTNPT